MFTKLKRKEAVAPKVMFEPNDAVKVTDGPFMNFSGIIEEVDPERGKLKISVSIFGRITWSRVLAGRTGERIKQSLGKLWQKKFQDILNCRYRLVRPTLHLLWDLRWVSWGEHYGVLQSVQRSHARSSRYGYSCGDHRV